MGRDGELELELAWGDGEVTGLVVLTVLAMVWIRLEEKK